MANDLNQCTFIGRLGKDPETRYLANGDAATNFSIAVGESWKDKQGQKQERTEWVNVSCFGRIAEICGEYLRKGSRVMVSGKMKTDKWQDQSGNDRYTTKIMLRDMNMLDSRAEGQPAQAPQQPQQQSQQQQQQPQQRQPAQQQQPQQQQQYTQGHPEPKRQQLPQQHNNQTAPQQQPQNLNQYNQAPPQQFEDDTDIPFSGVSRL